MANPAAPTPDLFSVSRRFDLATLLVAMAAYALLFTGLRLLDFPQGFIAGAAALCTVVAIGQAVAFGRSDPRLASVFAAYFFWLVLFNYFVVSEFLITRRVGALLVQFMWYNVAAGMLGVVTGYLVGVLAAGVFLVSHHVRHALGFAGRRTAGTAAAEQSPWEDEAEVEIVE